MPVDHLREIALGARQARKVRHDHSIETAGECSFLKHQDTGAVAERGAADTLILETLDHRPTLALDIFGADAHLIGDGGLVLPIRAESGIESGFHFRDSICLR